MVKLTAKQEAFCREYLIDLNATQAAIRAGYSEKTARSVASENLSKPDIADYICILRKERNDRVNIDADAVLRELMSWMYYDATVFMSKSIKEVQELPENVRRLITGFKIREDEKGHKQYELSFVSKEKAIEAISKHIGFYEKDNTQRQPDLTKLKFSLGSGD